jgi:Fe-S-cluster-containing hydrogenase component 2
MVNKQKAVKGLSRREFLTGAEAVVALSATAGLAAYTPTIENVGFPADIPVSDVIKHNAEVCAGCGVCGLMCALSQEGEIGPSMARSEIVGDPFIAVFTFNVCQQCKSPNCYAACPRKDSAMCIDPQTGVKYVNTKNCTGCGKCGKACPFTPPRAVVQPKKSVSFKCDLCRDRKRGPICIQYCSMHALTRVPGSERG